MDRSMCIGIGIGLGIASATAALSYAWNNRKEIADYFAGRKKGFVYTKRSYWKSSLFDPVPGTVAIPLSELEEIEQAEFRLRLQRLRS